MADVRIFGMDPKANEEVEQALTDHEKKMLEEPVNKGEAIQFVANAFKQHHVPLAGRFGRIERITLDLCNFLQEVGLPMVSNDGVEIARVKLSARELSEYSAKKQEEYRREYEAIQAAKKGKATEN